MLDAWPYGDVYVLEQLWRRLGMAEVLREVLDPRKLDFPLERALFAMVAQRACAPGSKLACHEQGLAEEVRIEGTEGLALHHLYRAMDLLEANKERIEQAIYYRLADLFNLDVELLFYDTTSLHFKSEEEDKGRGETDEVQGSRTGGAKTYRALRKGRKSKNTREDAPQIVVGLALIRDGFPVRHWVFAGNTVDVTTVEKIKAELKGWKLGRCVFVGDAGMVSERNLKALSGSGGRYLVCMPIHGGGEIDEGVLSRPGCYRAVAENLRVKEIVVGEGERRRRYVLCHNPQEEARQREHRARVLAELQAELQTLRDPRCEGHSKRVCGLRASRRYGRYLQLTAKGALLIDEAKVKAAERLDGKFLVHSNDDTPSAEELALGYKQLQRVKEAWRTLKSGLPLRPVFHWAAHRIHAHVFLTVLALLLERMAEAACADPWRNIRTDEAVRRTTAGPAGLAGVNSHDAQPAQGVPHEAAHQCADLNVYGVFCLLPVAILCGILFGCGRPEAESKPPPSPIRVTISHPAQREIIEWDEYTGRLEAIDSVEVRARVSGYLQSIHFKDGAMVNPGSLLFVIDPCPYQAVLERAKAQVTQAQARLALASARLKRAQWLLERNAASQEDYDTQLGEQRQAAADLEAAKAGVEAACLDVEFTEVKAPISGRISRNFVSEGNLINGGTAQSSLLTRIVSLDPIYCYLDADERAYLKYVRLDRTGQRPSSREVKNPIYLALADEEGFPHKGHIDFVDNRIDPSTGTMRGRAVFPNPDLVLTPGLFASPLCDEGNRQVVKNACSWATTAAPSPTAAATRLTEPARTSPIANTPGRLVSSGSGKRSSGFQNKAARSVLLKSAPVLTKPFPSSVTPQLSSQHAFGTAPTNRKTWRSAFSSSTPVALFIHRTRCKPSLFPARSTISVSVCNSTLGRAPMRSIR